MPARMPDIPAPTITKRSARSAMGSSCPGCFHGGRANARAEPEYRPLRDALDSAAMTTGAPTDPDFDPDALREKYRAERDKRLRPEGNDQYVEVRGDFAHFVEDPYVEPIEREPLTDEVEVVVIGGGFGGLLA